jgi:hypothetical protein
MATILITGGSGLIGKKLSTLLESKGYTINILTRNPKKANEYAWNIQEKYIDEKALKHVTYIIHLAGAGLADKRWSEKRKQEIIDSRVQSAELLLQKTKEFGTPVKGFISASGIGYYGAITSEKIFEETDAPSGDFIGTVCKLWEAAALQFNEEKIRTVVFRIGVVFSKNGGALSKMKTPIITPIGSGKQYIPWIHIDDLCELYLRSIEDPTMEGIYNAVAPEHHSSLSLSKTIAKTFKKPFLNVGAPAFLLKLIFGELSILLLTGSRISSNKLVQKGFVFQFPKLKEALKNLI